jgi:predicted AAA+ superfamily ATPase
LLRRGKEVFYYSDKNECDFLIREGLEIVEAIQVVYQLEAGNYERECRGLSEAMSTYNIKRGLLIIYGADESFISGKEGIEVIPIWKWLLA